MTPKAVHVARWEAGELVRDPFVGAWLGLLVAAAYLLSWLYGVGWYTDGATYFQFTYVIVPLFLGFLVARRRGSADEATFRRLVATHPIAPHAVFWGRFVGLLAIAGAYLILILPGALWYALHLPMLRASLLRAALAYVLLSASVLFIGLTLDARLSPKAVRRQGLVTAFLFGAFVFALNNGYATLPLQTLIVLQPSASAADLAGAAPTRFSSPTGAAVALTGVAIALGALAYKRWVPAWRPNALAVAVLVVLPVAGAIGHAATVSENPDYGSAWARGGFSAHLSYSDGDELPIGEDAEVLLTVRRPRATPEGETLRLTIQGEHMTVDPSAVEMEGGPQEFTVPLAVRLHPTVEPSRARYVMNLTWDLGQEVRYAETFVYGAIPGFGAGLLAGASLALVPFALAVRRAMH